MIDKLQENTKVLKRYGYECAQFSEFQQYHATGGRNISNDLMDRAVSIRQALLDNREAGNFIIFDPHDDADGFMLIGNDALALTQEAIEFLGLTP